MQDQPVVEESLETMIERIERQMIGEEQTELDVFEELERQMATVRVEAYVEDEFIREDEFTCLRCNMIVHRSRMADPVHRFCDECAS